MNKLETVKIVTVLKTTYPNSFKDMNEMQLETLIGLYELHFKNYDYNLVSKAIFNITSTDEFAPTIARIKKEIAKLLNSNMPKAEDEWIKVIDLVHKYGVYNIDKAMDEMNEFTRYVVKIVGYTNICMSSDNTWNKKEFIAEYNALKERKEELIQVGGKENLKIE